MNYDYIEVTTIVSTYDYSDSYSEGSGELDDQDQIELEDKIPNCSKYFKIPEFNKIVCLVDAPKSPREAANYCKTNGMRILKISDDNMKQIVFEGTKNIFGIGLGTALWVDGTWNEDEEIWQSLHDGSEVDVHPKESIFGSCTRIYSPPGKKFEISSNRCEIQYYFYCEKMINE